ncbi:MAG: hypothetical protein WBM14_06755 [Terracidiphilus sp.]
MRTAIPYRPVFLQSLSRKGAPNLKTLLAAGVFAASLLAAQSPAGPPAATAAHRTAHHHARSAAAHPSATPAQASPASVSPPPPAKPNWPINDRPAPATVTWDSHGLRIDAANSSLQQILNDVAAATGTKVEGMGPDERVFGAYGPGEVHDVLSQLLHGSGYNVLMIGDQGQGAPRQIVLSARRTGNAPESPGAAAQVTGDDDAGDSDTDEQPQPPPVSPPAPPTFGPGAQVRTPQQILQEMQERQRQMQDRVSPPNQ